MVAVPVATPVTMPVEPTVAVAGSLLLHEPPGVASANVVVAPMQTESEPVIAAGEVITVIVNVVVHVPPNE